MLLLLNKAGFHYILQMDYDVICYKMEFLFPDLNIAVFIKIVHIEHL